MQLDKLLKNYRIRKFDKKTEVEFLTSYNTMAIPFLRFSLFVLIFASFAYAFLDLGLLPDNYLYAWFIRFAIWIPLFIFVLYLSYRPVIIKRYQLLVTTVVMTIGFGVLAMIIISEESEQAYIMYYAGIGVVMTFTSVMHLRFKSSLLITLSFSISYFLVAVFKQKMLSLENADYYPVILTSNSFFLFSIAISVIITTYTLEIYARSNFFNNKRLTEEKLIAKNQNLILQNQNNEIQQQKLEIENNHKKIISSVNYASRIQNAMLPAHALFKENFSEYFIFFQPREIVSGDFYWIKKVNNTILFAAADCTGHGIPGAFLSILGMSFLNEVSSNQQEYNAGQILNNLRESIKTSLNQRDINSNNNNDGMDIALCVIDLETKILQYAGAYNPLYLKRKGEELMVVSADRQPIGINSKEDDFTNHTFHLKQDDVIYLFSDGFIDQFKEKTFEKYKISRFNKLLVQHSNLSLKKQKLKLVKSFEDWKGEQDQTDDVVVIGVKI